MKLILRQYLASLRERGELDAILPDLLSQMGLNVFSRPGIGTRQDGVDVGAVGRLRRRDPETLYLFSIKPGNLTRQNWNNDGPQSLRPSLCEIIDSYIPNRLPAEHQGKHIVICIALGGDVEEKVRTQLTGFEHQEEERHPNIRFEEWNGDRLAQEIEKYLFREALLPPRARSRLRKSLALLDEPEASYRHFAELIVSLAEANTKTNAKRTRTIRQMTLCLWVLFAWAREVGNLEAAYLSSELTLLHGWKIVSLFAGKKGRSAEAVQAAFASTFFAYQSICAEFLDANVLPHVGKLHAISRAIQGSCGLDVNLKLFDIIGRLAIYGIWSYWGASCCPDDRSEVRERGLLMTLECGAAVKELISTNPALLLPAKDDQVIDICIAALLLAFHEDDHPYIAGWLAEILGRASLAYQAHSHYPCVLSSYSDLLSHPKGRDDEYRKDVTGGSVLYPMIALWAALLGDEETYDGVARFKRDYLAHCNFQFWYPDAATEADFYTGGREHGTVFSDVPVDRPKEDFVAQAFAECEQGSYFREMSAVKCGWWPVVVVGCRHYRMPVPLQLLEGLRKTE